MTMIVGLVVTALFLYAVVMDMIWEIGGGSENLSSYFKNIFGRSYPYLDSIALYMIYIVGYAIVWWKSLWGSVIIILVSILGFTFSEYGDVRFSFLFIFLVGLLYLLNWNDARKRKKVA